MRSRTFHLLICSVESEHFLWLTTRHIIVLFMHNNTEIVSSQSDEVIWYRNRLNQQFSIMWFDVWMEFQSVNSFTGNNPWVGKVIPFFQMKQLWKLKVWFYFLWDCSLRVIERDKQVKLLFHFISYFMM